VNAHTLDLDGCKDQISVPKEINSCEDELFSLMKAVTMAQEKHDGKTETVPTMYLSARKVIWHMICNDKTPMVDLSLSNATYRRCDNSDSSNYNTLEIEMMQGTNLLPNSLYTDVLGPYCGSNRRTVVDAQQSKIIRVYWHMLESIGGIPIMDHFGFPFMVHDYRQLNENRVKDHTPLPRQENIIRPMARAKIRGKINMSDVLLSAGNAWA
jgi:hypothetical protein